MLSEGEGDFILSSDTHQGRAGHIIHRLVINIALSHGSNREGGNRREVCSNKVVKVFLIFSSKIDGQLTERGNVAKLQTFSPPGPGNIHH